MERSTVVGVFADHGEAERAVRDLLAAGFAREAIGFVARHPAPHEQSSGLGAMVGGYAGAASGGVLGGLLGLAISAVLPGVGHILAAGMVGLMLGGAYVGGLAGALIGMGIPEPEAHLLHREVEAGRTLVTVKVDGRYSEAVAILAAAGARDVTRQAAPAGTA
jgi:hypothetical protein